MQVKKYFEKKVSLLSTSDVRYDGELYTVDPTEQSIALKHVNCMGTEGRRTGDQAIAPSDCTYEFIIFRAVNIHELWLDEGNGRKRDLTDEILTPLRTGAPANQYGQQKGRQDMYDNVDSQQHPKRKVGYSQQRGQMGGYDPYYQQPRQQSRQQPRQQQFDPYYQRPAYPPPPPPQQRGYGDQDSYPPLPNASQQYQYGQQPYYDRPMAQQPYQSGGYRQQQQQQQYQQYNAAPPYRRGYYGQPSYYQGGGGYRQYYQSRPRQQQQQQQRGYYSNRGYGQQSQQTYGRSYNRGYGQQQRRRRGGQQNRMNESQNLSDQKAGTGAYLDRRLRGDDIDVKDAQDFDFGAAKFGDNKDDDDASPVSPPQQAQQEQQEAAVKQEKESTTTNIEKTEKKDDGGDNGDGDKTETETKYDKNKSFFDGLITETKKNKPKQDINQQKEVDTQTFGTVAETYKSRHINRPQRGQRGQNRYYQQNRNRSYQYQNQPRRQQQQNQPRRNYYQQQQGGYNNPNRWVPRT